MDGSKELEQTLVYCALMVGLKPEKFEIDIIKRWLIKHWPSFTLGDIANAFEINITSRHWDSIKPYGSFNAMFVGEILSQYDIYKRKKIASEIKQLPDPEKKKITHAEAKPMLEEMERYLKKIERKTKI